MATLQQQFDKSFFGASGFKKEEVQKLLVHATYAGDPTNVVVPDFQGQFCRDSTGGHLYWSSTEISSGWKKLNN